MAQLHEKQPNSPGNSRTAKKIAVAVLGGTVLMVGICLIVLPGPAVIVIPAGLAILATEFVWARNWLRKVRGLAARAAGSVRR